MGHRVAVHQEVARLHPVAFLDRDVAILGDQVFAGFRALLFRPHDDAPFGLVILAEFDTAGDFRNDREVLRLAGFEQFRHPRQAAGDVAGLAGFPRNAGQHVAGLNLLPVLNRKHRADRHEIARLLAVRQHDHLTVVVAQGDPRAKLGAFRLLSPVDHNLAGDTGRLVDILAHGDSFGEGPHSWRCRPSR